MGWAKLVALENPPERSASGPAPVMKQGFATLAQLAEFDEIIDARSPAEYAEDHIPGAVNCPSLDDAERAMIGTLYKQVSPFEAKKAGAALVARHIADYLETRFIDRPRQWKPLIYCWRGGKRSGAFATIFRQIGWDAAQLEGGYKSYRRQVVTRLEQAPLGLRFRVICGATGSAKSRILQALGRRGAQTLDLESLAAHKGSVLGGLPDDRQPGQRMFETRLLAALQSLDPAREVFVEAESRRIGNLQLPDALIATIRAGACLNIDATLAARVSFLVADYDYFLANPAGLSEKLACLRGLQSRQTIERWLAMVAAADWPDLVAELLELHYDPLYRRSQGRNYLGYGGARRYAVDSLDPEQVDHLAERILDDLSRSDPPAKPG